jgi:hypothetical protein
MSAMSLSKAMTDSLLPCTRTIPEGDMLLLPSPDTRPYHPSPRSEHRAIPRWSSLSYVHQSRYCRPVFLIAFLRSLMTTLQDRRASSDLPVGGAQSTRCVRTTYIQSRLLTCRTHDTVTTLRCAYPLENNGQMKNLHDNTEKKKRLITEFRPWLGSSTRPSESYLRFKRSRYPW